MPAPAAGVEAADRGGWSSTAGSKDSPLRMAPSAGVYSSRHLVNRTLKSSSVPWRSLSASRTLSSTLIRNLPRECAGTVNTLQANLGRENNNRHSLESSEQVTLEESE